MAAWSDLSGVAILVLEIEEAPGPATPPAGDHVAVTLQPASCQAKDRRGLARYLKEVLPREYAIRMLPRAVRVEWIAGGYTPH